jgi:translocation and assembly module TamA
MRSLKHWLLANALLFAAGAAWAQQQLTVKVEGITGELLHNVRAYLSADQQKGRASLTEARVRQLYAQAPQEIKRALQALGYYRPQIHSELQHERQTWVARFRIEPGAPVRIAAIDFRISGDGRTDPKFAKFRLPFRVGDRLQHAPYEQAKRKIQEIAADRGYFDAAFSRHQIEVNLERNEARIALLFNTGPRYRLGQVSFEHSPFDPRFLARFVPFKPGEPYTSERLLELQTALSSSDYFSSTEVRLRRELAHNRTIPVQVILQARPKQKFSAGLGYGTDTGPRAKLGWENRRINRRGHRLATSVEVSSIRQSVTAAYEIPLAKPLTDRLAFQAGWKKESTTTSDSKTLDVGVKRTRTRASGWVETLYLDYQNEDFTVGDQKGHANLVLPGVTWTRTKADQPIRPTRGYRFLLDLKATAPALGSDNRLFQTRLQSKLIRSVGTGDRVLLRGDLGATEVSDFNSLPATLRFFAGGDQSIRGYAYDSLGPKDASGNIIGGRYLLVGSVEYEHALKEKWGVAFFLDGGNAINKLGDPLKQGVGLGVRWRSPVGPIRLDLGVPVERVDSVLRLHFSMGPDL